MLEIIRGRHGYGKSSLLLKKLSDSVRDGKKAVLIVPEQTTVQTEREIASWTNFPMFDFDILSFSRLSDKIAMDFGEIDFSEVTPAMKYALMFKVINELHNSYSFYPNGSADYIDKDFVNNMIESCDSLNKSQISIPQGETPADSPSLLKLKDIILTNQTYKATLENELKSYPDKLSHLISMLKKENWFKSKSVFIDGFDSFNSQQTEIIKLIIEGADDCTIALPYFDDDNSFVFKRVNSNFDKISGLYPDIKITTLSEPYRFNSNSIRYAEKYLFDFSYNNKGCNFSDSTDDIKLYSCKDKEEECRIVAAHIKRRIREDNKKYSDFAVVVADISGYSNIIASVFKEYEIPYFESKRYDIGSSFIVRGILSLLKIIKYNYSQDDVISFVKTGTLIFNKDDIETFENYLRLWNISGSTFTVADNWDMDPRGFTDYERTDYENELLEKINSIRFKIINLVDSLNDALKSKDIKRICSEIFNYYDSIDKNLIAKIDRGYDIYNAVSEVLDSIVKIYSDVEITLKDFYSVFDLLISNVDIGRIPRYNDRVIVSSAGRFKGDNNTDVCILGVNDGVFPAKVSDSGLLNKYDYTVLQENNIELYDSDKFEDEKQLYLFYNIAFYASDRLIIAFLEGGTGKDVFSPSIAVNRIQNIFNSKIIPVKYDEIDILDLVENHSSAIREALLDKRLSSLDTLKNNSIINLISEKQKYSEIDPGSIRISQDLIDQIFNKSFNISPSNSEAFSKCPFMYHMNYVLEIKEKKSGGIRSLDIGIIVHRILEIVFKSLNFNDQITCRLSKTSVYNKVKSITDSYLSAAYGNMSIPNRIKYTFNRIARNTTDLIMVLLHDISISSFKPLLFEYRIGGDNNGKYCIDLGEIGKGYFSGRLDRLDVAEKNGKYYIRIIDYKTGTKAFSEEDINHGVNLQMPLYMHALLSGYDKSLKDKICSDSLYNGGFAYIIANISIAKRSGNISDEKFIEDRVKDDLYSQVINSEFSEGVNESKSLIVMNDEQLNLLSDKVECAIKNICSQLSNGVAYANPINPKYTNNKSVCNYCNYKPVCKNASVTVY